MIRLLAIVIGLGLVLAEAAFAQSPRSLAPFFSGPTFATLDLQAFSEDPQLFKRFKILQTSQSEEERCEAFFAIVPAYGRLSLTDEQSLYLFLAALNDQNVAIQTHAAHCLGGSGFVGNLPGEAVRNGIIYALIAVLQDRFHEGRAMSCQISDDQGYGSDTIGLRQRLVQTLGIIGNERVVKPILDILVDSTLSEDGIVALGELARTKELKALLRTTAITPLRAFLLADNRSLQVESARTLRKIDPQLSFEIVNLLLKSPTADERARGAIAMELFDDDTARDSLIKAISDEAPRVRANAICSLARGRYHKDEAFVTAALPLLKDSSSEVRACAAYSFSNLTDQRICPALRPLLVDGAAAVRTSAVHALGRCGDKGVYEELLPMLDDSDPNVRYEALSAFDALGDTRAIEPIRQRIDRYTEFKLNAGGVLERLEKVKK